LVLCGSKVLHNINSFEGTIELKGHAGRGHIFVSSANIVEKGS
jgi:hypothetical protein